MILEICLTFLALDSVFSQNPSSECLNSFRIAALKKHNQLRALHRAPALTLNSTISTFSQNYAVYLAQNNLFAHSKSIYGENLAKAAFSIRPLNCSCKL